MSHGYTEPMILAALREVADARDAEWAAALDPLNVGTDYGKFLADPKRARLLLHEREQLAVNAARQEEREALRKLDSDLAAEPLDDELLARLDGVVPGDAAQIGYAVACSRFSKWLDARSRSEEPKP